MFDQKTRELLGLDKPRDPTESEAILSKWATRREEREKKFLADIAEAVVAKLLAAADAPGASTAPALVDAAEAARILGITVSALRTRTQRGRMPLGSVVHTGRRVQYKLEALRAVRPYTKRS